MKKKIVILLVDGTETHKDNTIKWILAGISALIIYLASILIAQQKKRANRTTEDKQGKQNKQDKPETVEETEFDSEPQRVVVMTRYGEEQIEQILNTVSEIYKLTPRESDVFRELLMGKKQGEISYDLGISISTVKDNARRIYTKLDVANKEELFVKVSNQISNTDIA